MDLDGYEKEFADKSKKDKYYFGEYRDRERIRHISALIEYFEKIDMKQFPVGAFELFSEKRKL